MNFIDHTGHIFLLDSYNIEPIGYEYEECKYVFWFTGESGYKISIDNYAVLPIRCLLDKNLYGNNDIEIDINIKSNVFALLGSKIIQEKLEECKSLSEGITLLDNLYGGEERDIKHFKLTNDDLVIFDKKTQDNEDNYIFVPFYVIVNGEEPGTWETNILIHAKSEDYEEWCPITVGAELVDECEELIINGRNTGTYLPKEITKALYNTNYRNSYPDENMYAQKLKEYLMNFMQIKGITGSYKSAINGLKWFGWGDKISLYKLLKNDNEWKDQYIRDNFEIINDNIFSYRSFKNDASIALVVPITFEGEQIHYDFDASFWGEDKPEIKSLFEEYEIVHYDEGDLDFYRSYFDFSFADLGFKLCLLKYYYEKYFLPIHMSVNSVSMSQQVWSNDIKYISQAFPKITADPIFVKDNSINVKFPAEKILYFNATKHIIDENYIEWNESIDGDLYDIYDTLIYLPIRFIPANIGDDTQYYDVMLTLYKEDKPILSRSFQFIQEDLIDKSYLNLIIHPKTLNTLYDTYDEKYNFNDWIKKDYTIDLIVNGSPFTYTFVSELHELNLSLNKLEYKYDERFRQICNEDDKFNFLSFMHASGLVTINNIDFIDDLYFYAENLNDYINEMYKYKVNIPIKYMNRCHLYKLYINGEEYSTNANVDNEGKLNISLNEEEFNWDITDLNNTNIDLYKDFFDAETYYQENLLSYTEEGIGYDIYLMKHLENDKFIWYVVLISKKTIDGYSKEDLKAPEIDEFIGEFTGNTITLEYEASDEKFLVNRFALHSMNGINHFKKDDIIAFSLTNNDRLMYKTKLDAKWTIKPMSINMDEEIYVDSPTEIAIVSIGDKKFKYQKGYYDIICRYSIDDYFQESQVLKAKFRVD